VKYSSLVYFSHFSPLCSHSDKAATTAYNSELLLELQRTGKQQNAVIQARGGCVFV